jgi:uncharacterized protein
MSYATDSYVLDRPVADAPAAARAAFIRRTYFHLLGAVLAFIGLEAILLSNPAVGRLVQTVFGDRWSWLLVLGGFMAVSWLAHKWANSTTSVGTQYAGLVLYVVAEAILFVPLLWVAQNFFPDAILSAGIMTLLVFAGLTAGVLLTGADFSFLGPILWVGGFVVLGVIVAAIVFNLSILGVVFAAVMVAFACAAILYDTSNVLHHYRTDQHVAASLSLFASVALLFWYILQLVMLSERD